MGLSDATPIVSFSKEDITTDVAGMLAISQRTVTQSYVFSQTAHPLFISSMGMTGGAVTLDTAKAALVLSSTTASGSAAIIETKKVVQYLTGQAHTVSASLTWGTAKTNVSKRWGLYANTNGLFFEQTGTGLRVVHRTSISGSTVDTTVAQANWNLDTLDGTGPSGFNLDVTKGAVFLIEYTWHGAGRVRFGIKAAKANIYVHEFDFDNAQTFVYSRNPYQPVRAEIFNTAAAASATDFFVHTLSAYVHNHKTEVANIIFSASNGVALKNLVAGSYRPLIAIRPALLFNSRTNRVTIEPVSSQIYAAGQPLHVEIILNPTTITGASWASVNSSSAAEVDVSATAFTGGTIISEFYVSANTDLTSGAAPGSSTSAIGSFPLGLSIDGTSQDVIMIVARTLSGSNDGAAAFNWKEYQ